MNFINDLKWAKKTIIRHFKTVSLDQAFSFKIPKPLHSSHPQASAYKDGILSSLTWEIMQGHTDHSHLEEPPGPDGEVVFHEDGHVHDGEDEVARKLAGEVRVLCWIMTAPENHQKKVSILCSPNLLTLPGGPREGDLGPEVQQAAVHELRGFR